MNKNRTRLLITSLIAASFMACGQQELDHVFNPNSDMYNAELAIDADNNGVADVQLLHMGQ